MAPATATQPEVEGDRETAETQAGAADAKERAVQKGGQIIDGITNQTGGGGSQGARGGRDLNQAVQDTGQHIQDIGKGIENVGQTGEKLAEGAKKGFQAMGKAGEAVEKAGTVVKDTSAATKAAGEAVGATAGAGVGGAIGGTAGTITGGIEGAAAGAVAGGVGAIPGFFAGAAAGGAEGTATGAEEGAEIGKELGRIPGELQEKVGEAMEQAGKGIQEMSKAGEEAADAAKKTAEQVKDVGKETQKAGQDLKEFGDKSKDLNALTDPAKALERMGEKKDAAEEAGKSADEKQAGKKGDQLKKGVRKAGIFLAVQVPQRMLVLGICITTAIIVIGLFVIAIFTAGLGLPVAAVLSVIILTVVGFVLSLIPESKKMLGEIAAIILIPSCLAAIVSFFIGGALLVILVAVLSGGNLGGLLNLGDEVYLNQGDDPWGSQIYCGASGAMVSVGGYGCTVTTGAMALRSIGVDTDPEKLSDFQGTDGLCPTQNSWGYGPRGQEIGGNKYGVTTHTGINTKELLIKAVNEGHAVGIYAQYANSLSSHSKHQNDAHSVLVVGVNGDELTIMDPSDRNGIGKSKKENVTRTCSLSDWVNGGQHWGYYYTR